MSFWSPPPTHAANQKGKVLVSRPSLSNQDSELHKEAVLSGQGSDRTGEGDGFFYQTDQTMKNSKEAKRAASEEKGKEHRKLAKMTTMTLTAVVVAVLRV